MTRLIGRSVPAPRPASQPQDKRIFGRESPGRQGLPASAFTTRLGAIEQAYQTAIEAIRLGKQLRFRLSALIRYLEDRAINANGR
jgi:hypothetical protein